MDDIQIIADFCASHHGAKSDIRKAFEKLAGRRARRENFDRWLHIDPKKRTCPIMSNGIYLIQAAKSVMKRHETGR